MKLVILNFSPIDSLRINNYLRKTPVFYTKISSVGGIVSSGSYTYLIKVNDDLLDEIIKNLVSICRVRKVKVNTINNVEMGMMHSVSTTQKEGGGSLFVLDLEQFVKM